MFDLYHPRRFFQVCAIAVSLAVFVGCNRKNADTDADSSDGDPPVSKAAAMDEELFTVEEGFELVDFDRYRVFPGERIVAASDEGEIAAGADADPGNAGTPQFRATWTIPSEGAAVCHGTERGYLYSQGTYRNFTLRAEYRFAPGDEADENLEASNTGFLIYISGEHKIWPVSLEVQGKHSEMASIKANGGAADVEIDDDETARQQARRPVGEWNSVEIVSRDGALTSYLNGTKICESQPGELKEGAIGFQSEGYEVHFRNVRIRVE